MSALRTLVVCGTFNNDGGEPSGLVNKLFAEFPWPITMHNGGFFEDIYCDIIRSVINYDIVFWFPNIPNDMPKMRQVKDFNPHCMLVTSKRNFGQKYCFEELVSRALEQKANLCFEFVNVPFANKEPIAIRLFDPLGSVWCDLTTDYRNVMTATVKRLERLAQFTRQSATMHEGDVPIRVPEGFIDIIHEKAEVFHNLVCPPEVVQRFLGNASFRCTHGFPSFRFFDNIIAVSRRNVNKTGITDQDFVVAQLDRDGNLNAMGSNKPSVDTPIQIRLYKAFPDINFMIHSHVYVDGAPFTEEAIPCGALEEVDSIIAAVEKHGIDTSKSFALNLLGHGNTVFATSLEYFQTVKYVSRSLPEIMK